MNTCVVWQTDEDAKVKKLLNDKSPLSSRYREIISNSPFFSGLKENVIKEMLPAFRLEKWKKGTCNLVEESSRRFHVVASGRLEITRSHPETGRTVTLWLLEPGDVFDIVSLLDGRPHNVIPLAADDVEVLCAPMDTARRWLSEYPELCMNILPYLGQKFRNIENLATDLAIHDTMTRIASLILRHAAPTKVKASGNSACTTSIHGMSHEALARMVGTVRVVVNRHLRQWKTKGIIDYKRGSLIIKDLEALARWCKTLPESIRRPRSGGSSDKDDHS